MTIGAIRSIVVCTPTNQTTGTAPCSAGFEPGQIEAYVLSPESSNWFEAATASIDVEASMGMLNATCSLIVYCYVLAYCCKAIMKVMK